MGQLQLRGVRKRFGDQPRAAADIEQMQVLERFHGAGITPEMTGESLFDMTEAHRVNAVERLHRAVRIPPVGGQRVELRDLPRVREGG